MDSKDQCVMLVDDSESRRLPIPPQILTKIGHPLRKSAFQCTQSNLRRYPDDIMDHPTRIQNQVLPIQESSQNAGSLSPELHSFIDNLKSKCNKGTYLYIPIEVRDNKFVKPESQLPVYYQTDEKCDDASIDANTEETGDVSSEHAKSVVPSSPETKLVGRYTLKERRDKIRKYKEKILRWKQGKTSHKERYARRRVLAQAKPRFQGRFVKQIPS